MKRRHSFSFPRLLMSEKHGGRFVEISSQVLSQSLRLNLERSLPPRHQGHDWCLLYSSLMHGGSFSTFQRFCENENESLVAFETASGEVLGAFCSENWHVATSYFGNGESFVWRESPFAQYGWSAQNSYIMYATDTSIAMGGGGSFAWYVDSDFTRGSSAPCTTFGNPCLTSEEMFEVVTFEAWGFVAKGSVDVRDVADD